jgi:hypothetical protein
MIPLLALLSALASGASVEIDSPHLARLQAAAQGEASRAAPFAWQRELTLRRVEQDVAITARWTLVDGGHPGWFQARLAGPRVQVRHASWNGEAASLERRDDGTWITGHVQGRVSVELDAHAAVSPADNAATLTLLAATAGVVHHDPGDQVVGRSAARLGPTTLTGDEALRMQPAPIAATGTHLVATSAVGITITDTSAEVRARVRWEVIRGSVDRLSIELHGPIPPDLDVEGASRWRVEGQTLLAELPGHVRDAATLELSWSTPLAADEDQVRLNLPRLSPQGAFRTETAIQLARDGEREVVPRLDDGRGISARSLPTWAQGLVQGTATAAYLGATGGHLDLLRFRPVSGPPTVVDLAAITVATERDGHALMRAVYQVRNEQGSQLWMRPPPGMELVGVRVAGEVATPHRRDGGFAVSIPRSVETVLGSLSFPVEFLLLGQTPPWERRHADRSLELPTIGAPIAVTRTEVVLPSGYRSQLQDGERSSVATFSEGESLVYAATLGDAEAARADYAFQNAVTAWMSNEFDQAQGYLDDLSELGAANDNTVRLQSNLDLISGKDVAEQGGEALARRVREQASARAADERRELDAKLDDAKKAELSGDYFKAEDTYRQALKLGKKLEKLEQSEELALDETNADVMASMEGVAKSKGFFATGSTGGKARPKKTSVRAPVAAPPAPEPPPEVPQPDTKKPPAVTAAALTVVVPRAGEVVRYQHLLQPENTARTISIRARRAR